MPTSCSPHLRVILTLGLCLGLARPLTVAVAVQAAAAPAPQAIPSAATPGALLAAGFQGEDNEMPGQRVTKPGARVAMIDFETATLDLDRVKALSQTFWARLDATPGLALFPRQSTRRWLIRHDLFPFTPYMAPVPPHRVTGALKADYLLTGELNQAGGGFIVNLNLFSGREKRYVLKDIRRQCSDLDSLLAAFADLNTQVSKVIAASDAGILKPGEAPAVDHAAKPAHATPLPASRATGKTRARVKAVAIKKASPIRKSGRKALAAKPQNPVQKTAVSAPRPETDEEAHGAAKTEKAPAAASVSGNADVPVRNRSLATPSPTPAPGNPQSSAHSPAAKPAPAHEAAPIMNPVGSETRPAATPVPAHETAPAAKPAPAATAPAAHTTPAPAATPKPAPTPAPRAIAQKGPAEQTPEPASSAADVARDLERQQQLALESYNQKKYEDCIARCDKAITSTPESSMLLTIKGSALIELARYTEAAKAHETALRLDPQNSWAAYNLALALTWAHSDRAAGAWRSFLAMADKNPEQQDLVRQAREHLAKLAPAATVPAPAAAPKASPETSPTPAQRAKAGAKH